MNHRFVRIAALSLIVASASASALADYTHVIQQGDTLLSLGRQLLKRPDDWTLVQKHNRIDDPRNIPVGTNIRIPESLLKPDLFPARVGSIQGKAWLGNRPLTKNVALSGGEEIQTGPDGFVALDLADGSKLVLQPKSRLKLDQVQRGSSPGVLKTRLTLTNGRIENEVARQKDDSAGYQVQTPSALIAVRGTRFRVAAEGDLARAEVTEGSVATGKSSGEAVAVKAGQGMVVDAQKPLGQPEDLLPAPQLGSVPEVWERPHLRLSFSAVPGAKAYHVQLAKDADFRQVAAEGSFAKPELRLLRIPTGPLWLRVRAVSASGLEGADAVARFTARHNGAGLLSGIKFAWPDEMGATGYYSRVLSGDGQVVWSSDLLLSPAFQLDQFPPGDYFWQVESVQGDGKPGLATEPVPFALRLPGPEPLPARLSATEIQLAWKGEAGLRYELELAKDKEFNAPVAQRQVDHPQAVLPRPTPGSYFLRLRSVDEEGMESFWSTPQAIEIKP